jgi:hypothetical protein
MVITLTLAAASLWAGAAIVERFGNAPVLSVPGGSVPFAGYASDVHPSADATQAMTLTHVVARKADDRARPRGRRL